jgi:hypothetical protein
MALFFFGMLVLCRLKPKLFLDALRLGLKAEGDKALRLSGKQNAFLNPLAALDSGEYETEKASPTFGVLVKNRILLWNDINR